MYFSTLHIHDTFVGPFSHVRVNHVPLSVTLHGVITHTAHHRLFVISPAVFTVCHVRLAHAACLTAEQLSGTHQLRPRQDREYCVADVCTLVATPAVHKNHAPGGAVTGEGYSTQFPSTFMAALQEFIVNVSSHCHVKSLVV